MAELYEYLTKLEPEMNLEQQSFHLMPSIRITRGSFNLQILVIYKAMLTVLTVMELGFIRVNLKYKVRVKLDYFWQLQIQNYYNSLCCTKSEEIEG